MERRSSGMVRQQQLSGAHLIFLRELYIIRRHLTRNIMTNFQHNHHRFRHRRQSAYTRRTRTQYKSKTQIQTQTLLVILSATQCIKNVLYNYSCNVHMLFVLFSSLCIMCIALAYHAVYAQ